MKEYFFYSLFTVYTFEGKIFNKTIYFHVLLNYFQDLKVQDFENLLIPDLMFLDAYSNFCCLKSFFGSGWAINYK